MSTETNDIAKYGAAQATRRGLARALITLLEILLCVVGMVLLVYLDTLVGEHAELSMVGDSVSYGLLLLTGLFTGFHCVGMCGPLVIYYTAHAARRSEKSYAAHLSYGAAKTLSYTTIGALFGGLGAIVAFTPVIRGVAGVAAGLFLLLFGLGMLNVFAPLRRFHIRTPGFIMRFVGGTYRKHSNPFIIGLLNGLMIICGPLQAMYIMAAGTGSPIEGATMLFLFGVGTLPAMLGFGALTSALSARIAPKVIKASGFIVMGLGVIMLNRGLTMTGSGYDFNSVAARFSREPPARAPTQYAQAGYQVIHMAVTHKGFEPNQFTLRRGVPVKWMIDGKELDYCNQRIVVPMLGLEFDVKQGKNIIEFTPQQTGVIPWTCWMGMIPGAFIVREEDVPPKAVESTKATNSRPTEEASVDRQPRRRLAEWAKDFGETVAEWIEALKRHWRPDDASPAG